MSSEPTLITTSTLHRWADLLEDFRGAAGDLSSDVLSAIELSVSALRRSELATQEHLFGIAKFFAAELFQHVFTADPIRRSVASLALEHTYAVRTLLTLAGVTEPPPSGTDHRFAGSLTSSASPRLSLPLDDLRKALSTPSSIASELP